MTDADHLMNAKIEAAALWLADQSKPPRPIVPAVRERFGVSAKQACEIIALSGQYRMLRATV